LKTIKSGHRYELDNLKTDGTQVLQFYQDPEIHGSLVQGTSSQEVLRALIERMISLDKECPGDENKKIIEHLRAALILHEVRALRRKLEKRGRPELEFVGQDGHVASINGTRR